MKQPMKSNMKRCALALAAMLASGCSALTATTGEHASRYSLDGMPGATAAATASVRPVGLSVPPSGPTLVVSPPHAAAGFDSQRMMYVREAHKLEYFANNEWVDTPARMLAPLIVSAAERSGAFRAVVQTPSAASGKLRLDTEVTRLQHEFLGSPSRVRFTLRAQIVDNASRQVLASREFESVAEAPTENPRGGVLAANRAVQSVLDQLAAFCAESESDWRLAASR